VVPEYLECTGEVQGYRNSTGILNYYTGTGVVQGYRGTGVVQGYMCNTGV
jgi:hypothetical protein